EVAGAVAPVRRPRRRARACAARRQFGYPVARHAGTHACRPRAAGGRGNSGPGPCTADEPQGRQAPHPLLYPPSRLRLEGRGRKNESRRGYPARLHLIPVMGIRPALQPQACFADFFGVVEKDRRRQGGAIDVALLADHLKAEVEIETGHHVSAAGTDLEVLERYCRLVQRHLAPNRDGQRDVEYWRKAASRPYLSSSVATVDDTALPARPMPKSARGPWCKRKP